MDVHLREKWTAVMCPTIAQERQWFGARGGDGHAPSLPKPESIRRPPPSRAKSPPPLRAAAADHQPSRRQGCIRLLRQEPNFLGARDAGGESQGPIPARRDQWAPANSSSTSSLPGPPRQRLCSSRRDDEAGEYVTDSQAKPTFPVPGC